MKPTANAGEDVLMTLPFYRTIKQSSRQGFVRTVSRILEISMKFMLHHAKYLPETAVVEINGSQMLLYPKKGGIHRDLYIFKKREPICTDYLMHSGIVKKGSVVLDIGANIGYYVLIESALAGETGKVYAVEPVRNNFELLQQNVQLNNLKNVSEFQFAFGKEEVASKIFVSDKSNLCAMSKTAVGGTVVNAQDVKVETVDAFLSGKAPPKLIRMDVEGYEYEIIKGMPQTLKSSPLILMEMHPHPKYIDPEKMNEMLLILEQNHYRVKFVVFEEKVIENKAVRDLAKKAGNKLPVVAHNTSIQELKKLLKEYGSLASPNVVFEKSPG